RLARAAHDLDPNDATAKRLVEQYEQELASFQATTSTPLGVPPSSQKAPPPVPANPGLPTSYKVVIDMSAPAPRIGQTVELTARVAPPKGPFDGPGFTIAGPSGAVIMPASSPSPGVFKATYAFLEGGKYEVAFNTNAEGKP